MFNVWTKLVDEIRPPKYQSHEYEYTNCEYEYKYSKLYSSISTTTEY